MKTYSFEKLDAWQKARKLSVHIYTITKSYPQEEKFGLVSQMRRAAISVNSNLAEGVYKISGKEKARYSEISFCSLMELLNQGIISCDLGYLSEQELTKIRAMVNMIAGKITRLRQVQLTS